MNQKEQNETKDFHLDMLGRVDEIFLSNDKIQKFINQLSPVKLDYYHTKLDPEFKSLVVKADILGNSFFEEVLESDLRRPGVREILEYLKEYAFLVEDDDLLGRINNKLNSQGQTA